MNRQLTLIVKSLALIYYINHWITE